MTPHLYGFACYRVGHLFGSYPHSESEVCNSVSVSLCRDRNSTHHHVCIADCLDLFKNQWENGWLTGMWWIFFLDLSFTIIHQSTATQRAQNTDGSMRKSNLKVSILFGPAWCSTLSASKVTTRHWTISASQVHHFLVSPENTSIVLFDFPVYVLSYWWCILKLQCFDL